MKHRLGNVAARLNSKELTEACTRGGACGLIRIPRKTLPIFVSGVLIFEIWNLDLFKISFERIL